MPRIKRQFSREFKLTALARFEACSDAGALAREMGIRRELFYRWRAKVAAGGEGALRPSGRPRPAGGPQSPLAAGDERVAQLERIIGRQQVELDFFREALQQVREERRRNGGPGDPASTR